MFTPNNDFFLKDASQQRVSAATPLPAPQVKISVQLLP